MGESPVCLVGATSSFLKSEFLFMIDILVYLFENYHDFSSHPKPDALARKLNAVGFESGEVSVALGWLAGLKNASIPEFFCNSHSLRIYSAGEQNKLGVECLSFISFLETAEIITPALRELIIERGMILDDAPVPLSKFKIIVLMVLWSREQGLEPLIVEELLFEADPERMH
jgi:Smg protein